MNSVLEYRGIAGCVMLIQHLCRAVLIVKTSHGASLSQLLWGSAVVFLGAKYLLKRAGRLKGTGCSSSSPVGFGI